MNTAGMEFFNGEMKSLRLKSLTKTRPLNGQRSQAPHLHNRQPAAIASAPPP
jgi:hypothetical protein